MWVLHDDHGAQRRCADASAAFERVQCATRSCVRVAPYLPRKRHASSAEDDRQLFEGEGQIRLRNDTITKRFKGPGCWGIRVVELGAWDDGESDAKSIFSR